MRSAGLAFVSILLATGSVSADKYWCPDPAAPEHDRPDPDSFTGTGGLWFGVQDRLELEFVGCRWIAENGDSTTAVIQRFPARPDTRAIDAWLWFSSREPLDSWWRWRLECRDAARLPTAALPIVAVAAEPPTVTLEHVYLERWSCRGQDTDVLRVRLSPIPSSFWTRGGALRVRYPDGLWAVTLPEPEATDGLFAPLPAPTADESALTLELVDGGGAVVASFDVELEPELWLNPTRGPVNHAAAPRGCRR